MDKTTNSTWPQADIKLTIREFLKVYQKNPLAMAKLQSLIESQPALKEGSHHWRPTSEDGREFTLQRPHTDNLPYVLAWSQILDDREVLCAINLDQRKQAALYVTIDQAMYAQDEKLYRFLGPGQIPAELNIEDRNGKSVRLTIPPNTLVIYGKRSMLL
ncbi:hypothetical protein [Dyadobacter sp. CY351]|uniref:hypothetical protein n=1 Tax=Dyadobacter sp. CY351 TaxID=2909337 RepID=UPI001F1A3531|nr:hypothetical protein [Dyadobacter sp. CY351]MCF2518848.1 hypothetical protein [Dyadobacter sp. CY351]